MRWSPTLASLGLLVACSGGAFSTQGEPDAGVDGSSTGGALGATGGASSDGGARAGSGGTPARDGGAGGGTPNVDASEPDTGAGGTVGDGGSGSGSGGLTQGTGGSGGTATGTGGTAAGGTTSVITRCPESAPDTALPCRGEFQCTYGDDPRVSCRATYSCKDGTWLVSLAKCTAVPRCEDQNPLPVIGKPCDPQAPWCEWSDTSHLTCGCLPCANGSCTGFTWTCQPAASPTSCAPVAPNVGQPCDSSGPSDCKYAFCPIDPYVVAHCRSGEWSLERPPCN